MKPFSSSAHSIRARAVLAACGLLAAGATVAASVSQPQEIPGLQRSATLIIDRWGIAHIYARTSHDAYFLQGYNAARDRLWQIDLWRKRGLGRLAQSLGPAYVAKDRAARLFLYRGDIKREWAAYAPGAQAEAEAFTAGINAYVEETRKGTKPLPVEFQLTASTPEFWKSEDVVRIRSHGLVDNVKSEVERAQVACKAGLSADRLRALLEPPHQATLPAGLDPCLITADVLQDYDLGTKPVRFAPDRMTAESAPATPSPPEGSNNWVIAPSHTTTGRPTLANDPHRSLTVPSLRYIVHLEAPGLSLIGAGEPALPGISLGHNGRVGFGLTIFEVDQEDLYVYELNPADPNQYRYRGGWEKMQVVHESIEVKGGPAQSVELRFTRHGPVLRVDPQARVAFALRTVWSEPGTAPYFMSTWLAKVKNWHEFQAAIDRWGAPPLNLVYADIRGNIGWAAGARVPVRLNWDGLLPVPGDGRYEWKGYLQGKRLPSRFNPKEGWVATANEMNLSADQQSGQPPISFEWANRSRIDRINAVLASKQKLSLADSMALQNDNHDMLAGRLTAMLTPLAVSDSQVSHAMDLLKRWDLDESVNSAAASIYQVWVKHLLTMTSELVAASPVRKLIVDGSLVAIIDYLQHPDLRLGTNPLATRDDLLIRSLSGAVAELKHQFGDDMTAWRWGRLHQKAFTPAIASLADPALRSRLTLPAVELGGSGDAPHAAGFDLPDFAVVAGASVRIVLDVGDWDRSVTINAPGQSGDASSAHYSDLLRPWAEARYVPLLYSRAAIEKAAETVMSLAPAHDR